MQNPDLIDPIRIRSSLRRLFDGQLSTAIAELLQNSQRAGATLVEIATDERGFTYTDNGTGVSGIEGFHQLLSLGSTHYPDWEQVEPQAPMGIGLHSVLALEPVTTVTLSSGGLSLSIEPARWWEEEFYFKTWRDRLSSSPVTAGFSLRLESARPSQLGEEIEHSLPWEGKTLNFERWSSDLLEYPAWGYEGILNIHLNGVRVYTGLPLDLERRTPLTELTYKGCPCRVMSSSRWSEKVSLVRWYGQLIPVDARLGGFSFLLRVERGRPVNPQSPVRAGLIHDEAYLRFLAAVEDAIFAELSRDDTPHATVDNLRSLFFLNGERARSCPYFIAGKLLPYEAGEIGMDEELELVCRYGAPPLLVQPQVAINGSFQERSSGIGSFVPLIEQQLGQSPHVLILGNSNRLVEPTLVWTPGESQSLEVKGLIASWFRHRGTWCLEIGGTQSEPVPVTSDVVLFDSQEADPYDVSWLFGCEGAAEAFERFHLGGLDPYEELDPYAEECKDIVVLLRGVDWLPRRSLNYWELIYYAAWKAKLPDSEIRLESLEFTEPKPWDEPV